MKGIAISGEHDRPAFQAYDREYTPSKFPSATAPVKRSLDVVLTFLAITALLPILAGIVLLMKTKGSGPVFYGHERIGLHGRTFRCWKFRTMHVNGDEILREYLAANHVAKAQWDQSRKLRDDPRVTPLGQVLRNFSLDELPQLFNVLLGDMSLVGPRPVVSEELSNYGRSLRYYLSTRPGITGLWQISGRSETSYARRIAFDRYYATRRTTWLDLVILVKTVPAVLGARGAY